MATDGNEPQDLLTVKETARLLRLSPFTVYRAIERGRLDAYRLGGERGPLRLTRRAVADYFQPAKGDHR